MFNREVIGILCIIAALASRYGFRQRFASFSEQTIAMKQALILIAINALGAIILGILLIV